jgi:hypothetical protein
VFGFKSALLSQGEAVTRQVSLTWSPLTCTEAASRVCYRLLTQLLYSYRPLLATAICTMTTKTYPKFEDHQRAWEELAHCIASIQHDVRELPEGELPPHSKDGELIIIGSGIETIGIALGDKKLIEDADKVLFCVADPATIVWLKRLRPDALDLYVLYGDDKVRYTTYMQMAEAQLYWVRQGLKVVVVFYGHPGVFVLSTHRAIKLARREGHKAIMKASVCALDTLCADLGVDPCHPGLQTHEATDSLIRQRTLDTSLHVVLWQVGLIGELGYRRQGYLNSNFSYFISWLQGIYGPDYKVTHYVGSRYPTVEPLIEIYKLSELHNPENQAKITGLSTFYIPPRDVVPSHLQTVRDLGIISEGQQLVTPKSPLREIGQYGPREMKAFHAFANFRIPPSYKWQPETEASNFLIELRFDTKLQDLYSRQPQEALNDKRFSGLSDRERALLASRDSGAIQIACKGAFQRSVATEKTLTHLLNRKSVSAELVQKLAGHSKVDGRNIFNKWLVDNSLQVDWASLHGSIDFINRNSISPWTGVYLEPEQQHVISIIGNQADRTKSVVYINNVLIKHFVFDGGVIKWQATKAVPFNGFIRPDVDLKGNRRIIGKIWPGGTATPAGNSFTAKEIDPARKALRAVSSSLQRSSDIHQLFGNYTLRTNGRFKKQVNTMTISTAGLAINGKQVDSYAFEDGNLSWKGGDKECYTGEVTALIEPITNSIEFFGCSGSNEEKGSFKCYGSSVTDGTPTYSGPLVPDWAAKHLVAIAQENSQKGGLLFWHKWEKQYFTSLVMNKYISNLI